MKRGLIIGIILVVVLVIVAVFIFLPKNNQGSDQAGLEFNEIDYDAGVVDLEFEGGSNTFEKVETNPFRYGEENA